MSSSYFLFLILAIDVAFILLALFLGKTPDIYFKEKTFITYLSVIQLLVCSVLTYKIFKLRKIETIESKVKSKTYKLWALMSMGFAYLALDDATRIHENIDKRIHILFHIKETNITDRLDDLIVGFYVICGIIILFKFYEEIKLHKHMLSYLIACFIPIFLMVALDLVTERKDVLKLFISDHLLRNNIFHWLRAIEEIFKIIAGGILVSMFYYLLNVNKERSFKNNLIAQELKEVSTIK